MHWTVYFSKSGNTIFKYFTQLTDHGGVQQNLDSALALNTDLEENKRALLVKFEN